jgi:FtsH-binding integral membrane protein
MSVPPKYSDVAAQYGSADDHDEGVNAPLLGAQSKSKGKQSFDAADAALISQSAMAGSSRNAWMDQPDDDIPDDFKVGVNVSDCDEEIRRAFLRKVYAILLVQLALTSVVGGVLNLHPGAKEYVQNNAWIVITSIIGSFASLAGVYFKRHSYPANMIVLALFTFFESIMVGTTTTYYDGKVVIQAVIITAGVFVGLTLFTFQTKLDFSGLGPFLFAGLMGLITAGFVQIFLPFSHGLDVAIACGGVLIFSGYILYDTQQIMKRLSVDEAILGEHSATSRHATELTIYSELATLPRRAQPVPLHSPHREYSLDVLS